MELINSKSLLAKLMATENLRIEQRNVPTASFDVKNRVLTIPILSSSLSSYEYDLFVGHEVGHALYTPLEGLTLAVKKKYNMGIMNVLEDSRIERKIKNKYPGIRSSFKIAYNELLDRNFFETKDRDLNEYNFIDRVNLYCKCGVGLGIQFTEEEKKLLALIESTRTYNDVIRIYPKIAKYMLDQAQQEEQQPTEIRITIDELGDDDFQFGDNEENSGTIDVPNEENKDTSDNDGANNKESNEAYNSDSVDDKSDGESNDGESNDVNSDGESNDDKDDDNGELDSSKNSEEGSGDFDDIDNSSPHLNSETDDAYSFNQDQLFSKQNFDFLYANLPDFDLDKLILDYTTLWKDFSDYMRQYNLVPENEINSPSAVRVYQKFRNESKNTVSYLVKEFELRKNADQSKKAKISKTGDLNLNKIFSYKFNEDIFKKVTNTPGGKSHGLVMFLDWSGSMDSYLTDTIKQTLNLVMFCRKVNIPYEVYAFSTAGALDLYKHPTKKSEIAPTHFKLMNLLSSRMTASEHTYAASNLLYGRRNHPSWMHRGGTPLNESILAAIKIVPEFKKKYKLQEVNTVFLTDGDSSYGFRCFDSNGCERGAYSSKSYRLVVRDPITKYEITTKDAHTDSITKAYLEMLKVRTNSNVIGFFVMNNATFRTAIIRYGGKTNVSEVEKLQRQFVNDKCLMVDSYAYDEYYFLSSSGMSMDEEELVIDDKKTVHGMANAFSKFNSNRKANRIILNRFINLIT